MPPSLARYINKTLYVSIPALFEDGTARPYTLIGVEMIGLWLQSDELTDRLLRDDAHVLAKMSPAVFVPFAQIAGVLIATSMPPPADECRTETSPSRALVVVTAPPVPATGEPAKQPAPAKPPKRKKKH